MIWINIGTEAVMIGLIVLGLLRTKSETEKKKMSLIQLVGMQVVSILPISDRRRDKNQVFQIMCQIAGEEEGKNLFLSYRQKRWGRILGVVLLMNTICLLQMMEPQKMEAVFENHQDRPEYGQGTRSQQVTVILKGEDTAEEMVSIQIPEKEISEEEARQRVAGSLIYINDMLDGLRIKEDIKLPTEWNEVSLYYKSLAPDLLSHTGKWLGSINEEAQQIQIQVTAVMGKESQSEIITLYTVTLAELSPAERLKILVKDIEKGKYLTDNELILPEMTEEGESLIWIEKRETEKAVLVLLGSILLLFVLWQQDQEYKNILKERDRKTKLSYPEFMNELVILVGAGLSLPAAWQRIAQDYQHNKREKGNIDPLYEEIYRESQEMEAGASMREVLEEFAGNVRFKEARRFAVLLTQNLKRGDSFLISRLKELNQEAWKMRKKQVMEKTEEADMKLLLPLMLMLIVILIIVLSPAMITMQI